MPNAKSASSPGFACEFVSKTEAVITLSCGFVEKTAVVIRLPLLPVAPLAPERDDLEAANRPT